ncbi:MAG: hypothetical protein ACK2UQ_02560, partial [Anaerolineae bacterium]
MRRKRMWLHSFVFVVSVVVGLAACTTASSTSPPEPLTSPSLSATTPSATVMPEFDEEALA